MLKDLQGIGALKYMCVVGRDVRPPGLCVIRQLPPEKHSIQKWLEQLDAGIEWCGEGLPALTHKVFNALLKSERRTPPTSEKARILKAQDGRCNSCGGVYLMMTLSGTMLLPFVNW